MNNTFLISELASRPACTLSAIEQWTFNQYCKAHTDEAILLLKAQHPNASLDFLTAKPHQDETKQTQGKELVYGLKGLASILGCSVVTASRIKLSGVLDKATSQIGRKLVFDKNAVLELAHTKKGVSCYA